MTNWPFAARPACRGLVKIPTSVEFKNRRCTENLVNSAKPHTTRGINGEIAPDRRGFRLGGSRRVRRADPLSIEHRDVRPIGQAIVVETTQDRRLSGVYVSGSSFSISGRPHLVYLARRPSAPASALSATRQSGHLTRQSHIRIPPGSESGSRQRNRRYGHECFPRLPCGLGHRHSRPSQMAS